MGSTCRRALIYRCFFGGRNFGLVSRVVCESILQDHIIYRCQDSQSLKTQRSAKERNLDEVRIKDVILSDVASLAPAYSTSCGEFRVYVECEIMVPFTKVQR